MKMKSLEYCQKKIRLYQGAKAGTSEDCDKYLRRYLSGRYSYEITKRRKQLEKQAYEKAKNGTSSDCLEYLKEFPNGLYDLEIERLLVEKEKEEEEKCFMNAKEGTFEDCNIYLKKYPKGKYTEEIIRLKKQKVEDNAFDNIYSVKTCVEYLRKYTEGKYVSKVITKLLDFLKTIENCDEFLEKYPGNSVTSKVIDKRNILLREKEYARKVKANAEIKEKQKKETERIKKEKEFDNKLAVKMAKKKLADYLVLASKWGERVSDKKMRSEYDEFLVIAKLEVAAIRRVYNYSKKVSKGASDDELKAHEYAQRNTVSYFMKMARYGYKQSEEQLKGLYNSYYDKALKEIKARRRAEDLDK